MTVAEDTGKLTLQRSIGGLSTALSTLMSTYPLVWIGWAGTDKRLTEEVLRRLHFPKNLIPIAIEPKLFNRYYNRMSNGVLWPLLHSMEPPDSDQTANWKASQKVTALFANATKATCSAGDLIWIHDYHLALLPAALRGQGVTNRIGFFLHTPFPTPDVFAMWRYHGQLLRSLREADVIGFQTARDVENFHACLRATGIRLRPHTIVQAYPIGIDFKAYRAAIKVGAVSTYLARVRRRINRKKVILSVSRLDYTKGIIEQLRAVERVLANSNPKKLLYRLIVAPSREAIDEYRELKLEIDRTVNEINSRFMQSHGVTPIDFEYRSHGFEELNAWYRAADILLVTPLIDGMNLVVKEYVAARGNYRGIVVLSKTAGAAAQLHSAVQVDPSNISDIRCGITDALEMPLHERKRRWQALRNNVKQEDIFWWSKRFLRDLAGTTVRQAPRIRRRRPKLLP